jgi:low temperature requirement protein LtrA
MTTGELIERFAAFTIIVLGETLTGVVAGLSGQLVSRLTLGVGLVAVVVGFGVWRTYFDFAGHRHPRPEPAASLQWMLGHLPLTAAVAAMGAAMVSLVGHAHDGRTPAATGWVLCAGAAVVLYATMLVSASLQAWPRDRGLYRPHVRRRGRGVPRRRRRTAAPLVLCLALILLLAIPGGPRRRAPPGQPSRLSHRTAWPAEPAQPRSSPGRSRLVTMVCWPISGTAPG